MIPSLEGSFPSQLQKVEVDPVIETENVNYRQVTSYQRSSMAAGHFSNSHKYATYDGIEPSGKFHGKESATLRGKNRYNTLKYLTPPIQLSLIQKVKFLMEFVKFLTS
jgi:hypothetical protein